MPCIIIYFATKPITCATALQLIERGQLSFTDPLYEYLPEYREMYVKYGTFAISPAKQPIRIVDLFTMCAGLRYDLDIPHLRQLIAETGRDFVRALTREPLLFEPGQGWNYSYCHNVLGAVIETVSSMTSGAYLKRNICRCRGERSREVHTHQVNYRCRHTGSGDYPL